jgi:hypothetical protein
VEDILEYIYANITGQLRAVEATAPEIQQVGRNTSPAKTEEHLKPFQPTVKPPQPAKSPQPIAKPLVKNETYTIGHWNGKPLEWLILDVQPDKALLIARECLLMALYNEEQKPVTWDTCSLRKKLMPQLLEQIFNEAERDRILLLKNKNPKNASWNTPGGADTDDKLFLLSIDEVKQYFPYDKARVARLDGETVWWWLRSPGYGSNIAANVYSDGYVHGGGNVGWSEGAVRPAFWLNLKS